MASLTAFIRSIWTYNPFLIAVTVCLLLLKLSLESVSLFLILPLLALSGVAGDVAASSGVAGFINQTITGLGIKLEFTTVLILFLGLILLRSIVGLVQSLVSLHLQNGYLYHLRHTAHDAILSASWPHLAVQDTARLNHALSVQAEQSAYGVNTLARLISAGAAGLVSLIVVFSIDARMSAIITGLALLVAIPVMLLDIRSFRLSTKVSRTLEDLFSGLGGQLADVKTLKTMGANGTARQHFDKLAKDYRFAGLARGKLGALTVFTHEVAAAVLLVGVIYLSVTWAEGVQAAPVAVAIIFIRLFAAARTLQSALRELLNVLPGWQRFWYTVQGLMQAREDMASNAAAKPVIASDSISLKDVAYAYPGSDTPVLADVNLHIPAGTSVGLVGLSGAGKTTLLDLLGGLLQPSSGHLLIDGQALPPDQHIQWRSSVAYVVQDAQLANETVREAITRYWRDTVSDDDIWAALARVGAEDIVAGLPRKLDEKLGDRGQRLSRGQRQRIALARALVGRPKVLILDEATSALSARDESDIIVELEKLLPDMTIIVVTHRPTSVEWVDQLFELSDGQLKSVRAKRSQRRAG